MLLLLKIKQLCLYRILHDLANVNYSLCNMIISWSILQKNRGRRNIGQSVEMMTTVIQGTYSKKHGLAQVRRLGDNGACLTKLHS